MHTEPCLRSDKCQFRIVIKCLDLIQDYQGLFSIIAYQVPCIGSIQTKTFNMIFYLFLKTCSPVQRDRLFRALLK